MNNKVLVRLIVPLLEKEYEVFLPANKRMGELTFLLAKGISDICHGDYQVTHQEQLYSRHTGQAYEDQQLLKSTDIRNGSELIFM